MSKDIFSFEAPEATPVTGKAGRKPGFKMSKESKERISAAQKARWAKVREEKDSE